MRLVPAAVAPPSVSQREGRPEASQGLIRRKGREISPGKSASVLTTEDSAMSGRALDGTSAVTEDATGRTQGLTAPWNRARLGGDPGHEVTQGAAPARHWPRSTETTGK